MIAAVYSFIVAWLVTGLVFAILFAIAGAPHIPRESTGMSAGARLLVIPGATILWPWLLWRWVRASNRKRTR